ncbi:hypothetical protein ACQYRI_09385 [Salmonella enterica]
MNRIAYSCWSYEHSNGAALGKTAAFEYGKLIEQYSVIYKIEHPITVQILANGGTNNGKG